jgi:hypothetical protein
MLLTRVLRKSLATIAKHVSLQQRQLVTKLLDRLLLGGDRLRRCFQRRHQLGLAAMQCLDQPLQIDGIRRQGRQIR